MADWILVVDDDDDVRETMTMLLDFEGFNSVSASNGQKAMDVLSAASEKPCLILLDMWMPVMDGVAFLKNRLKNESIRNIPTYLFSADINARSIAQDLQATGCLPKPAELNDVVNTVRRHFPC